MRLLALLKDVFSDSESSEVQDFIDVGEYGLALDTLIDIVDEESKVISREALDLIKQLATVLGMNTDVIEERLANVIAG